MGTPVYFSRSRAALHGIRAGWSAFRTFQPFPADKTAWTIKQQPEGPGIKFAKMFAEGKDFVHHCEVTDDAIPVLVVTCFREEIIEEIPEPLILEPITPELWAHNRDSYPRPRFAPPRLSQGNSDTAAHDDTTTERAPRAASVGGAVAICKQALIESGGDRATYTRLCEERGVIKATMNTQWSRLRAAAKGGA